MPNQLITASVIYDGSGAVTMPDQLMPPGLDKQAAVARIIERQQMVGTPLEQLCEIAGRSCYDSLGAEKSRSSAQYHPHILQVQHLSTVEHAAMTVNIHVRRIEHIADFALLMLNRPNVFVRQNSPYDLRVTLNLRHILEWDNYRMAVFPSMLGDDRCINDLGVGLRELAKLRAPQIAGPDSKASLPGLFDMGEIMMGDNYLQLCPPTVDDEKWVSVFMTGSRGFSHEQVRHGDWTAISQRSTRFVDESTSAWVEHPLVTKYLDEVGRTVLNLAAVADATQSQAQHAYRHAVELLEPWLIARGVDKATARKQARGAARGYLGNALYTEIVFSASVSQWKRMIRQRLSPHADAEIREVYTAALPALKACRYGDCFDRMTMAPSPDGIGQVLVEA